MAAIPILFLDANILYAAPLRDVLMQLAVSEVISIHWTAKIQDEWTIALATNRPDLSKARIQQTRETMERTLPHALVAGYEPLIDTLVLPDMGDRHVLAGAITAEANLLLTFNLTDFPSDILESHNVAAVHPDSFLSLLIITAQPAVINAVAIIRKRLHRPGMSPVDYMTMLARAGLPRFATLLSSDETLI